MGRLCGQAVWAEESDDSVFWKKIYLLGSHPSHGSLTSSIYPALFLTQLASQVRSISPRIISPVLVAAAISLRQSMCGTMTFRNQLPASVVPQGGSISRLALINHVPICAKTQPPYLQKESCKAWCWFLRTVQ